MIPLRDNIPSRTTPVVNYSVIAICGLAFLGQLAERGGREASLVERFGMIPLRVVAPEEPVPVRELVPVGTQMAVIEREAAPSPLNPWFTLLTCIFLHGGWMHFLGNMWFLFIFGDNVEDRMGHVGYLLFYLFCGVAASAAHLITNPSSPIPTIGASGAIAGVMGAYLLLYPRAMVLSVLPIFIILQVIVLPAPVFLGIWFVIQFFQGAASITSTQTSGVAWWAHIGGFAVGFLIAAGLRAVGETSPPVKEIRPHTDHVGAHRYRRYR
jgi:membrane associated rhomboid family serine protease